MNNLRKIPFKNYVILGFVIFMTILCLVYFYKWFDIYEENIINRPILDNYLDVINYNELDDYLIENQDKIIYVSVLEDKDIRNFEIKFKSLIKDGKISYDILYMDITVEYSNKKLRDEMKSKYYLNDLDVTNVPCILFFKSGKLNEIYSIKDNNYDIDNFIYYINNIDLEGEI